jgi:glycyl-tRNA synthetase (class II)
MAKYIELLIGKADPNIKVLNELTTFNYDENQIEEMLKNYDEVGIPYDILLDEKSLKDGLFQLRNRNTTLSETIHLSDVTDYLVKIFNSK